jgi:hypothetical protein
MAFRRGIVWTRVAIGAVLAIGALPLAVAQAPRANRDPPPPYRPAARAKDPRALGGDVFRLVNFAVGLLGAREEKKSFDGRTFE